MKGYELLPIPIIFRSCTHLPLDHVRLKWKYTTVYGTCLHERVVLEYVQLILAPAQAVSSLLLSLS